HGVRVKVAVQLVVQFGVVIVVATVAGAAVWPAAVTGRGSGGGQAWHSRQAEHVGTRSADMGLGDSGPEKTETLLGHSERCSTFPRSLRQAGIPALEQLSQRPSHIREAVALGRELFGEDERFSAEGCPYRSGVFPADRVPIVVGGVLEPHPADISGVDSE